jgi:hypothetical protein
MGLKIDLIEQVHRATGYDHTVVQAVLKAVEATDDYEIVRVSTEPLRRRCQRCRKMVDRLDFDAERGMCLTCRDLPVDDRGPSHSIRTVSGGLPGTRRR